MTEQPSSPNGLPPPPEATTPREELRLARQLEAARGQVQALEAHLRRAAVEIRRGQALRAHWWTRLGERLWVLASKPAAEEPGRTDAEWLPPAPPDAFGEPATLDTLGLRVRRLRAEAREREERHAREVAAWRQERVSRAPRAFLEDYRREVRRRLRWDWPGWAWGRAVRAVRVRGRWWRRRLLSR